LETLFLILFWIIFTLGVGYSVLKLLFFRAWPFFVGEALALSYGIGIATISIQMALMSICGIKFSALSTVLLFLPLILAALFLGLPARLRENRHQAGGLHRKSVLQHPPRDAAKMTFLEKFFVGIISFEVIYAFFRTLIKPMESYDSIAMYAFKSKIFYLGRMVPKDFFKSFADFVPHIEYPLLIPLAEAQFYTFFGSLNDHLVKIIFPLYYVALLAIAYSICRRSLNRRAALFFTFLLATIPQVTDFATNGYADIPFAFYCSASFFYLYLWLKDKRRAVLALSFIFSVFAIWTKAEGLLFTLINAAVVSICMVKEKRVSLIGAVYALVSFLAVIAYVLGWRAIGFAVNSDFAGAHVPLTSKIITGFKRIPAIFYEYQIQFFGPKKWNIIWILFIAGFIVGFKRIFSKELFPVTMAMLLVLSGYSMVYMLSSAPQGFGWHLSTSGSRLFLHFVPIAVLWLALMFKELKLEI